MAQFRVYQLRRGILVLDLQSDLIETATRVVAPLVLRDGGLSSLTRLEPLLDINGTEYVLHTAELAAVPAALVRGEGLADCREHDYAIRKALDMVFSGF